LATARWTDGSWNGTKHLMEQSTLKNVNNLFDSDFRSIINIYL
jgi:hypothetical protein